MMRPAIAPPERPLLPFEVLLLAALAAVVCKHASERIASVQRGVLRIPRLLRSQLLWRHQPRMRWR